MSNEIISNDTKVLVKGNFDNEEFIGIIVGSNEQDSEDFGLYYYIIPEGGDHYEDELMFRREDFTLIE